MDDVAIVLLGSARGDGDDASGLINHPIAGKRSLELIALASIGTGAAEVRVLATEDTLVSDLPEAISISTPQVGEGSIASLKRILSEESVMPITLLVSERLPLVLSDTLNSLVQVHREGDTTLTLADGAITSFGGTTELSCWDTEALIEALEQLSEQDSPLPWHEQLAEAISVDDAVGGCLVEDDDLLILEDNHELTQASEIMRERIIGWHVERGVIIVDPTSTYIEYDAEIGVGATILPFSVIMGGATVGSNCEVGPFTHLRKGAVLEEHAEVGNFTEVKNSTIGSGSKAKHLSYIGDTTIGKKVNIGAGTITANYDGTNKHKTEIADGAFIGSGSILVAPLKVGKGGITGAGAVVPKNRNVADGATVIGVPAKELKKDSQE